MWQVDTGLVLYVALIFLWAWRLCCPWRCCGKWMAYANWCFLLYLVLTVIMGINLCMFAMDCIKDFSGNVQNSEISNMKPWVRYLVIPAPAILVATFIMCISQTVKHVEEIRNNAAPMRHDWAIQIIALPAVYGVMAMSSMVRCYTLLTTDIEDAAAFETAAIVAVSKSETCFWVGDLYEAWALFQFANLSLEVIENYFQREQGNSEASSTTLQAFKAVISLAWMGTWIFVIVCVLQAGWTIWIMTVGQVDAKSDEFQGVTRMFTAAGMVASGAAIWNVHVVGSFFHEYLKGFNPVLKFITVKIVVSFAFFQHGAVYMLQAINATLPGVGQAIVGKVPFFGDVINASELMFQFTYSGLLMWEVFLIAVLHWFAWGPREEWYNEGIAAKRSRGGGEQQPLLA